LLANGADLRIIQTLLGHADIATTEIYTHVLQKNLQSLVINHHPLSKKDKIID
jgi:integrase/recombinase XerD